MVNDVALPVLNEVTSYEINESFLFFMIICDIMRL